jgi:hypothetical protein
MALYIQQDKFLLSTKGSAVSYVKFRLMLARLQALKQYRKIWN